jgi:CubicO group peptidase (beta-lactamase class C family)
MTALAGRLADAVRRHGAPGAVAGVSRAGERELATAVLTEHAAVRIASVTKPLVAFALLRACAAYGSTVDTPVLALAPELRTGWRAAPGVTLRQCLDHTSGLHTAVPGAGSLAETARAVGAAGQAHRPGAAWRYGNPGYWLAGYLLARMAGTTFEEALRRLILEPAGMTSTDFTPIGTPATGHDHGVPRSVSGSPGRAPSGGLWSTIGDLLSFAEYALGDGADLLAAATQPPHHAKQWGGRYALGWEVAAGPAGLVAWHDGNGSGFRARVLVVPAHRFGAAVVTNDQARRGVLDDVLRPELARLPGVALPGRVRLALDAAQAQTRVALALLGRSGGGS